MSIVDGDARVSSSSSTGFFQSVKLKVKLEVVRVGSIDL